MPTLRDPETGLPLDLPSRPGAGGAGGGWKGGAPTSNDPRTGTDPNWDTSSFLDWLVPILLGAGTVGGAAGLFGAGAEGAAGAGSGAVGGASGAGGAFSAGVPSAIGAGGSSAAATGAGGAGVGSSIAGGLGTAGKVFKVAQGLAPILGGAAANQSKAQQNQDQTALDYAKTNAILPGERLNAAVKAGFVNTAKPFSLKFNGPGSGMSGNAFTPSGGIDPTQLPQSVRDLANSVQQDELSQQLAGPLKPKAGTGAGDNVLGGAALGSGILGALLPILTKQNATKVPAVPGLQPGDPGFDWQTQGIG